MGVFGFPFFGKILLRLVVTLEGGQLKSKTLRKYHKSRNKVDVGLFSYGSCFDASFNVGGTVSIGRYCSIASDVHYFGANHPIDSFSSSAVFYNKKFSKLNVEDIQRECLEIGNDVWIGHGVLITKGCKRIGNGAIVGAGAVVTHDIPDYSIVAGNPSRIIRFRFSQSVIDALNNSKWWELMPDELIKYKDSFNDPVNFIKKLKLNKERD